MQLIASIDGLSTSSQTSTPGTKNMLSVCGQKWNAEVTQSGQHMAKDIGLSERQKEKNPAEPDTFYYY